jgi:hypothetical protein
MKNQQYMAAGASQSQQIGMPHITQTQSNYMSMQNVSTAMLDPSVGAYLPFKEKYSSSKRHQTSSHA